MFEASNVKLLSSPKIRWYTHAVLVCSELRRGHEPRYTDPLLPTALVATTRGLHHDWKPRLQEEYVKRQYAPLEASNMLSLEDVDCKHHQVGRVHGFEAPPHILVSAHWRFLLFGRAGHLHIS